MNNFDAIMIAEGATPQDIPAEEQEEQILAAWQHLIDTGLCWQLQGHFGRNAARLIELGVCTPRGNA